MRYIVRLIAVVLVCSLLGGCESIQFYHQALLGQSKLMLQRRSTSDLLARDSTDPELRVQLELAREILDFAAEHGLPADNAYESYVETEQSYVIWNVFAAEEFELALKTHCFPVAGCVSYRGFFRRKQAERYAERMAARGMDVFVGGVRAYSTLGWFDDPLLDTFLFVDQEQLAALLFHELAHRVAYAPDDTRFNESLATAIERHLLQEWLRSHDQAWRFERYRQMEERQAQVLALIEATRARLRQLYESGRPASEMRAAKSAILAGLKTDYAALSADWPEPKPFEDWMRGEINNARLETVTDYHGWVPAMERYLARHGLAAFLEQVARLAALDEDDRARQLAAWSDQDSSV